MTDAPASPDEALARRLRDDPESTHRLEELRRDAYGRAGSTAPLVEVPAALRERTGYDERELPAPLVVLLTEEARLADEGAALLAADAPAARAEDAHADPGPPHADDRPAEPARRRALRPGPLAAIVAACLVLAGLGAASAAGLLDGGRPGVSSSGTADASPSATAPSVPRGQAMGTPDGRRGAPVPDFTADPPVPIPPTDAELAEELRMGADQAWALVLQAEPDAVRPDVRMERLVEPEDHAEQQVACLREGGVAATRFADDAYSLVDADPLVVYACAVRFPVRSAGPRTDAELAYLRDYYASFLLPCYAAEGAPVADELPGVDEFIALARAQRPWSPIPQRMDARIAAACPEMPEAFR
jgi:hypothetical protein